ncbi:MAG: hypothetical protein WAX44_01770 [Minisyncoccia bacterium]
MKKAIALVGMASMVLSAVPALASVNSSFIKIETNNTGSIDNYTSAKAETGSNWAGGSLGGRGGKGGEVEVDGSGDYNNGGALAGFGGHGGIADIGGTVRTGNADAQSSTENFLNTTDVDVDLWGEDVNSSKIKIETNNDSCGCENETNHVQNRTKSRARTGDNSADGSEGGAGGKGGDVEASSGDNNNGGAFAGDAGHGGSSNDGGWIETGDSTATSEVVNVVNESLVRVRL